IVKDDLRTAEISTRAGHGKTNQAIQLSHGINDRFPHKVMLIERLQYALEKSTMDVCEMIIHLFEIVNLILDETRSKDNFLGHLFDINSCKGSVLAERCKFGMCIDL